MEVDYTRTLTKIDKMFRFKEISENEWRVLYAIFEKFNDFQFQSKSSKFANPEIMSRSLILRPATINAIFNKLAQQGLIEFDKGTRGGEAKTVTPLFFVYRDNVKSTVKQVVKSSDITQSSSATSEASSSVYQPVKSTVTLTSKAIAKLSKDNNKDVEKVDDLVKTSTAQYLSDYWQKNVMSHINGNQIQDLAQDAKDFGEHGVELVKRAIDETANRGATNFSYYSAIAKNWYQSGVKNLGDVDRLQQQRQKMKKVVGGSKGHSNHYGRQQVQEPAMVTGNDNQQPSDDFQAALADLKGIKTRG
ncbi:DnaD domain protein [Convivina intestini]|uniref:DnaD domain protein n=1 Tax=Convivina intestini TaxID=1505726 RepID=UPI00200E447E|nr:DnaD domain protein [Convivina intestini]CAH1853840.1 hypothetical protein R078131_00847 [Convivina intestini]